MTIIIDYGMGNPKAIQNMFKKTGIHAAISADICTVKKADRLVLPGVGSFDHGMRQLKDLELIPILEEKVLGGKTPIMGICLGMQLFTKSSEEGKSSGLGWIDAATVRFNHNNEHGNFKVPHMGWNTTTIVKRSNTSKLKNESSLFKGISDVPRFYFAHSYHTVCNDESDVLAVTHYGYEFVSVFQNNNIIGVQFHPEKSHKFGMRLLKNFSEDF